MKYVLLIYGSDEDWANMPEDELKAQYSEYEAVAQDPRVRGGAELKPAATATTVRTRNGSDLTTDGPFAETKEQLGGYFVVECDDLDGALELARRIPAAKYGGAVEVRPVVER